MRFVGSQDAQARALSFRNRLINGNFSINQRDSSSSSTTYAAGTYVMDRWKAGSGGVTLSFATAANGDVTVTITAGSLVQTIEGPLYLPEGGAYILSWGGTATGRVYQGGSPGSYAASPVAAVGFTGGNIATVEFTGGTVGLAQLEPGATATAFERRDDEMRRCQRYYETGGVAIIGNAYSSGVIVGGNPTFKVPKRTTPTVGATATFSYNCSGVSATDSVDVNGFRIYCTSTGASGNVQLSATWAASAEL